MKRILYTETDGSVAIIVPSPGFAIEQVIKDVPAGKEYKIIDAAEVPSDRMFRDAWAHHPTQGIIVDMAKAKEIHRDRLRKARKPLLEALDIEFLRAMEAGDEKKLKDVAERKQTLRDITKHPAIDGAKTAEELKSAKLL